MRRLPVFAELSRLCASRGRLVAGWLAIVLLAGATVIGAPGVHAATAPFCGPGDAPRFELGMAELREAVGDAMGEPVSCEHPGPSAGDRQQETTVGTAFYVDATGELIFTDGFRRWARTDGVLRYWQSPDAVPIEPATEPPPGVAVWSQPVTCPVLYGHEVPSAGRFRTLLQGLRAAGYEPTTLAAVDAALAGDPVPPGCLVLSLDDGLASQITVGLPVLAELGVPAVFFAMPGFADGVHRYMRADQILALHDAGMEVEAHTCNHPSLPRLALLGDAVLMAEVLDCRKRLERIIGAPVRYLAYPNGSYDRTVLDAVTRAGFRAAFTTRPSAVLRPENPLTLPRIRIDAGEGPAAVIARIHAAGG